MLLPTDGHVHSEWSWDSPRGSMEQTCARAVDIGLPAVAFTEHADYTPWIVIAGELEEHEHLKAFVTPHGTLAPPQIDIEGYLECLQRCRDQFPTLRILSGVELGEPHWHSAAARLLDAGQFDRVLGSLHCLPVGQQFAEPPNLYRQHDAAEVIRQYLAEIPRLINGSDAFAVLAHIDYPIRYWPTQAGPFEPNAFQDEFRYALRILADSGRALEVNTRGPLLHRSFAGGATKAETRSRLEATLTTRPHSHTFHRGSSHGRGPRLSPRPSSLRLLDTFGLTAKDASRR